MSHFLDRLTYFSQPRESFSDAHGVVTGEDRTWEDAYRNRWAHDAPGRDPSLDRVYRDLDTLALLAHALDPGSSEAEQLAGARAKAWA